MHGYPLFCPLTWHADLEDPIFSLGAAGAGEHHTIFDAPDHVLRGHFGLVSVHQFHTVAPLAPGVSIKYSKDLKQISLYSLIIFSSNNNFYNFETKQQSYTVTLNGKLVKKNNNKK